MKRIPFGYRAQHRPASTPPDSSQEAGSAPVQRFRWAIWHRRGMVPADLPPATLARGYRLAYDRPPARDPERRACRAYSAAELTAALAALGYRAPQPTPLPPPPAELLGLLWWAALQRLALPSTRMLLCHQARLLELSETGRGELLALVEVVPSWLAMVESRRGLVVDALAETMARRVALQLVAQEVEL